MNKRIKNSIIALSITGLLLIMDHFVPFSDHLSLKIYDTISKIYQRTTSPPAAIKDIVLVGIDSDTIENIKEKWPYSRATFAKAIHNLKAANPLAIGFDFSFFGDSTPEEDTALIHEIKSSSNIILPAMLKKNGGIQFSNVSGLKPALISGVINKFQDSDGSTREALTYLVSKNTKGPRVGIFSWELRLLGAARSIDLASFKDEGRFLTFQTPRGICKIPVDSATKTFLIRFQAHSGDFKRLSFYQVINGNFDSKIVENKIVLIGFLSELFQDIHKTPIGWLPGLTLNANALLTLHAKNFIKPVPKIFNLVLVVLGIFFSTLLVSKISFRNAFPWLLFQVATFFILSHFLFIYGYTWNYALFPLGVILIPAMLR